jgi:hypothetical protein
VSWAKIQHELLSFIKNFIESTREVLQSPQADPKRTVVILGILIILVAILVVLFLLFLSVVTGKKQRQILKEIRNRQAQLRRVLVKEAWVGRVIIIVSLLLLIAGIANYSAKPSTCASCHDANKEIKALASSPHSGVNCYACHQDPGVFGFFDQKVRYLRWVATYIAEGLKEPIKARVSNKACLRCHQNIKKKTVGRYGIRVRHKDFLDQGSRCTECHNTVAHGKFVAIKKQPSMDKCVKCHNAKEASARCSLCHTADIGKKARLKVRKFVKVSTPEPTNCRGCHDIQTCTNCHGLEMPHPPGWLPKGHAKQAFIRKEVCWRCHPGPSSSRPYELCNADCHEFPPPHASGKVWRKQHGLAALKKIIIGFNFCSRCHRDPKFCDLCHTGKREVLKYK